jgi:hypothetical protein
MKYYLNIETESGEKIALDFDLAIDAMEMAGDIYGEVICRGRHDRISVQKHDGTDWREVATITETPDKFYVNNNE